MIDMMYGWFSSWSVYDISFFVGGSVVCLAEMIIVNIIRGKVYKK